MPSPYATNEPHDVLWFEQSVYAAINLSGIGYGMHVIVFSLCVYSILKDKNRSFWSLPYVLTLFVLATITIGSSINFGEHIWIDERNYPGGPQAFILNEQGRAVGILGNTSHIITTLLADAFLIWRCSVVWGKRWYAVALPIVMLLVTTVLSVLVVVQTAHAPASLWSDGETDFSIPYYSISMSLNLGLTLIIASRLILMRKNVAKLLGPERSGFYTNPAAIAVECALPYAIFSLIFVILYGLRDTALNLFIPLLCQVEAIVPELILLRISQGHGWTADLATSGGSRLSSAYLHTTPSSPLALRVKSNAHRSTRTNDVSMINFQDAYGRHSDDLDKKGSLV